MSDYIFVFNSYNEVIKAEVKCVEELVKVRVIPLPVEIESSCGLALKVSEDFLNRVKEILNLSQIKWKKIYVKKEGVYQ